MVSLFCTQTSTIASTITASWCWKSVQLCNIFCMSMVSVVRLDNIDIFSWMEIWAILSMSGPENWSFSSAVSSSRFICGQMMSTFSMFGMACCTHWCASRLSFYNWLFQALFDLQLCFWVLVHLLKNELFLLTLPGLLLFEINVHLVSRLRLLLIPPLCQFRISGRDRNLAYLVW